MGRPRSFEVDDVVDAATATFVRLGYGGASVDDLVGATGLHRGSLYQAFGSKRGLFLAALRRCLDGAVASTPRGLLVTGPGLDLLLVAALELAPTDDEARALVVHGCSVLAGRLRVDPSGSAPGDLPDAVATLLGHRLLHRAGAAGRTPDPSPTPALHTDPTSVDRKAIP